MNQHSGVKVTLFCFIVVPFCSGSFIQSCSKKVNIIRDTVLVNQTLPLKTLVTPVVSVFDSLKNMNGTRVWTGKMTTTYLAFDSTGLITKYDTTYPNSSYEMKVYDFTSIALSPDPDNNNVAILNFQRFDTTNNVLIYKYSDGSYSSVGGSTTRLWEISYYFLVDSLHFYYYERISPGGQTEINLYAPKKH